MTVAFITNYRQILNRYSVLSNEIPFFLCVKECEPILKPFKNLVESKLCFYYCLSVRSL